MKKILLILFLQVLFAFAKSQPLKSLTAIDTDSINAFASMEKYTMLFIDSTGNMSLNQITGAAFFSLNDFKYRSKIPARFISQTFYLKFCIKNNSAQKKIYHYYPGKLYKKMNVYLLEGQNQPTQLKTEIIHDGFAKLETLPYQTSEYLLKLNFFKTGFNQIESTVISDAHINIFKNELFGSLNNKKTAGIILSGMLLMMIFVTMLNFFITKKIEFLYNSAYSLCMFLLIFLTTYLTMNPGWFKGFFISYLDLLLLIAGTIAYLTFTRHFLNTQELYPKLNKFLKFESRLMFFLMVLYSIIYFGTESYRYEEYLENMMKILLLVAAFVYIFLSLTQKNPLMNYLAVGVATQIIFSIVSLAFGLTGSNASEIYTSPIFYFELGIICSIIFFLLGLFYKNRQELILKIKEQEAMKLEVEKQSYENKLTIYKTQQEERNRISADMHDDLGAGMTSIRLYSELAKTKLANTPLPELEKISSSADELINNMNSIIWSMSSQNDSMGNMVAYIRSYAIEYLESTGIKTIVSIPENLPALIVNGTIRRNVFLVIKEALQNVVKHSQATEIKIVMSKEPEGFALTIHDNGKGIDMDNLRPFSNGLKNMKKRMQDINIEFTIENNNGTLVRLYAKTR